MFFFFFAQDWRKINYDSPPKRLTLPTRAELRGDFTNVRRQGANPLNLFIPNVPGYMAIDPATGRAVQPLTGTTRNQIPGQNLANLRFNGQPVFVGSRPVSPNARAIVAAYERAIGLADIYIDTPTGNNAIFQLLEPSDQRQEFIRLDYKFNDKHSIFGRYIQETREIFEAFGFSDRSDLPIASFTNAPGRSLQLSHTWVIDPLVVNEAKANASSTGRRYIAIDESGFREAYGFVFPQVFSSIGAYPNAIPAVNLTGQGDLVAFQGPAELEINPSTDISFSDNLSIVRGNHTIRTGALISRIRVNRNTAVPYTGNFNFQGANRANSTGNAIADALLGNFFTYSEASYESIGFFRATQVEALAQDNFKVRRSLSLEFGVRYYYIPPFHAQANNIANFVPGLSNPAQAGHLLRPRLGGPADSAAEKAAVHPINTDRERQHR